jgi:hypothetical protein
MSRELRSSLFLAAVLTFIVVLTSFPLQAQVNYGVIQGQIADPQDAAIPKVAVSAINVATNVKATVTSNETGFYLFPRLLPGKYRLEVEAQGFRRFVRENIDLSVDSIVRVDVKLDVGQVSEQVTVTGAPPALKTDRTDVSSTIQNSEARELPLMGRNVTFLMNIIPGTIPTGRSEVPVSDVNLNTNGVQAGRNYQAVDGIDSHEAIGGASLMVTSMEAVQEVKITTNAYDAEYGQIGGAMTMMITKSGTNTYHGTLFEYLRNNITSARNPFSEATRKVAPLRWNQFGGNVGGPIKKDKLFFFGSVEALRVRQGVTALTTVPLPAYRQGDFSQWASTYPIYDPTTGDSQGKGRIPFQNMTIPSTRINPTARKILDAIPAANTNVTSYVNNFGKAYSNQITNSQLLGRVDYNYSTNTQMFFRYTWDPKQTNAPTAFGEPVQPSMLSTNNSNSLAYNYIRTITPNFMVEGRFGYTRRYIRNEESDLSTTISKDWGIPNVNISPEMGGLMGMIISGPVGGFNVGVSNGELTFNHQTNFTYAGNAVWNRGRHTMKFGMEKRDGYFSDFRYAKGAWTFRETPTASADKSGSGISLASFMLGAPGSLDWRRQSFGGRMERQDRDGWYWQDQFRISSRLTLNFGLRYELYSPIWTPYAGGGTQYDMNFSVAKVKVANVGPISNSSDIRWDKNNLAPRFGIAYRLNSKMVGRLGYGRSYTIGQWGESLGAYSNQWPSSTYKAAAADNPYIGMNNISVGPPALTGQPTFDPSGRMRQPIDETMFGFREDQPMNYIDAWNATFQHEFAPNWTYEVAHVGMNSVHNWQNFDLNGAPPGPGPLCARQPYCVAYGITAPVNDRSANSKSNYFSFQAKLEKRFAQGWSFGQVFTYGKSIDRSWNYVQQNWCRECSKSLSDFDVATVSRTWFIGELPFGPGKKLLSSSRGVVRHIVEGWQIAGLISWRSGYALTPVVSNQSRFNAYWFTPPVWRPNRLGSGYLTSRSQKGWYNVADFATPADYTFGTSGRNIIRGPGETIADLDFSKSFRIKESIRLKLRSSMYNGLNIANLGNPQMAIDNPLAGQITGISNHMRRVEFGAQLFF